MSSKDPYSSFDPSKLVGKTPGGKPYFRPSSPYNRSVGLSNAMNRLRRPGSLEGANLSTKDAKEIENIIQGQFAKKTTSQLNRFDKLELRHKLEGAFRKGKLSRNDIKDADAIIDKLSKH